MHVHKGQKRADEIITELQAIRNVVDPNDIYRDQLRGVHTRWFGEGGSGGLMMVQVTGGDQPENEGAREDNANACIENGDPLGADGVLTPLNPGQRGREDGLAKSNACCCIT